MGMQVCGGKLIMAEHRKIRKGTRQRYCCKNCGRRSVSAEDFFVHKTYPAKAIVSALTHYNPGHAVKEPSEEINLNSFINANLQV